MDSGAAGDRPCRAHLPLLCAPPSPRWHGWPGPLPGPTSDVWHIVINLLKPVIGLYAFSLQGPSWRLAIIDLDHTPLPSNVHYPYCCCFPLMCLLLSLLWGSHQWFNSYSRGRDRWIESILSSKGGREMDSPPPILSPSSSSTSSARTTTNGGYLKRLVSVTGTDLLIWPIADLQRW